MKSTFTFLGILIIYTISGSCYAKDLNMYSFQSAQQQQQFQQLTDELRCLVCQNQNLSESNAPLAADLRQHIAMMISKHQTNDQIKNYLLKRYGDFILYNPPFNKTTWILWFSPFIGLGLGFFVLGWVINKRNS